MVTVDAMVKVGNRGRQDALPLALLPFPSALHITFSGKLLCSGNACSLDAWIWWDLLPVADQKYKAKRRHYALPPVMYNGFLGDRAQVWWPVLIGCCVGQTVPHCCRELRPALLLQVANHPSLSFCDSASRLQLHLDNTTILSLTLP